MVYGHFDQNISLLPSPEQILEGIIHAQIEQFNKLKLDDFRL